MEDADPDLGKKAEIKPAYKGWRIKSKDYKTYVVLKLAEICHYICEIFIEIVLEKFSCYIFSPLIWVRIRTYNVCGSETLISPLTFLPIMFL